MSTIEEYGAVDYTRGRDFWNPDDQSDAQVTIVGCGGIGSFTAHALAKLGVPKLTLIDFDEVEPHNVPNQLYDMDQVGDPKAIALGSALARSTNAEVVPLIGRITEDGFDVDGEFTPRGVIISALDNMEARSFLWSAIRMKFVVPLFIDGRLGGQNVVVYTANPCDLDDINGYEATLHSDAEGIDLPCTGRNVIDVGYAMAALVSRHVRAHYTGLEVPKITYQNQENLGLVTTGWLL